MAFSRLRFSLAQLLLLVALAAILVTAGILLSQPSGRPEYWASAVAFSPDGKTLAASLYVYHRVQEWDPTPRILGADASHSFFLLDLPDLHAAKLLERTSHPGIISVAWVVRNMGLGQSLAFSADGKTLATKGIENRVSLWNVGSGQKINDFSVADELTGGISWAEDGTLATSGLNATYILRPNAQGLWKLTSQTGTVTVVLSRDGSKLATANDDGKIDLWDARTGGNLHHLDTGNEPFDKVGLAISPDGRFVAGGICIVINSNGRGSTRIWDTATGKEQFSWELPSTAPAIAFSPDGKRLVSAPGSMGLHFFSLDGGTDEIVKTESWIASIAFSRDGKLLATGDSSGRVSLWDVKAKKVLTSISLVQDRDFSRWPIVIAASLVWLVLWRYACGKHRRSPGTNVPKGEVQQ